MHLISHSFQDDDNIASDEKALRELTNDFIFCPVCGGKNDFTLLPGKMLNYFCAHCHRRLNDYWEDSQQGETSLLSCESCQELTFGYQQYCISCGLELISRIIRPMDEPIQKTDTNLAKYSKSRKAIVGVLIPGALLIVIPFLAILITQAEIGTFWWEFLVIVIMFVLPGLVFIVAIIFIFSRIIIERRRRTKENTSDILYHKLN